MQRIAGKWWLPESPSEAVPGHLQREGDRWVLYLDGSLGRRADLGGATVPVILGRSADESLSLLDSRWFTLSSRGDVVDESWRVDIVLRGAAVEGWDAPAFDVAAVEFDDLAHFMNLRLVEIESRLPPDDDVREVAVIHQPPRIAARTSDSECELLSGWTSTVGMRDLNYRYRASLYLRLSALTSLSDVDYRHMRPMRYLLALATAGDIGTTAMRLGRVDPDDPHSQIPQWELLDVDHDRADGRHEAIPHHMLFTCSDWDFASGFPRWKELVEIYGPTCDLLFSRAARDSRYLSTRFLNAVTAAESFQRRWTPRGSKASPDQKFRVDRLVRAAPEEDRTWLRNKLAWSHEPSLADRLEELVVRATPAAGPYVGSARPWAQAVAQARNALVHRPLKRDDPDENPEALLVLEHSVAAVVTICLLRELGFDADDCGQRMSRSPSWRWVPKDMQSRHPALFA